MRLRIWKLRSLGLRARLTMSYAVAFSVVLLLLGLLFREALSRVLNDSTRSILNDESAIVQQYVRPAENGITWAYDVNVNEEAFLVRRLRRVLLIATEDGHPLEMSNIYRRRIGAETPEGIRRLAAEPLPIFRTVQVPDGARFLLRTHIAQINGNRYLITLGRSLEDNDRLVSDFTWSYYLLIGPLCVGLALLGWWLAGRGLKPLNDVAHAAQSISSSKIHTPIAMRGADDELDHLIATLNSTTERLEVAFNQMKHFSTDVSHELRTPLTTIRGQLEVALFTAKDEAQLREAIIASIDETDHLSRLVSALLSLAAAESGQLATAREKVDLALVCTDVASRFTDAADLEHITFRTSIERPCLIRGDRTQLDRLITNLVGNALKYTPGGGRVNLNVRPVGDSVELVVQDTGRGIAPQHLPHIFDRFYRVPDQARDPERGLGLGLSFVAWIVKSHGGEIDVASELGKGTTFRVTLPCWQGAAV